MDRPVTMVRGEVRLVARGVYRGRQPTGGEGTGGAKKIVVPAKSGARGGSN